MLAVATAGLVLAPGPAAAGPDRTSPPGSLAELGPARVWASYDGSTIYLVGSIGQGTFTQFIKVARANPKARTLFLASNGGMVVDGYLISNAVRSRGLDTWVEWMCVSSCTLIFASGQQRILGSAARLGFHQTFLEDAKTGERVGSDYQKDTALNEAIRSGDTFDPTGQGDDKTVRALRRANVSDAFITKVLRTPPQQVWYPELAELRREGVVTGLAGDRHDLTLPTPGYDRVAIESILTKRGFWRAVQQYRPEMYARAVEAIFIEANSGIDFKVSERHVKAEESNRLAAGLANAPDTVLSLFLEANAHIAASERLRGYPGCGSTPAAAAANDADFAAYQNEFDEAYTLLAELTDTVAAPTPEDAKKYLAKNSKRLGGTGVDFSEVGSGPAYECRVNFRVEEATNLVEAKYRIPLYRAMLVMNPSSAGK